MPREFRPGSSPQLDADLGEYATDDSALEGPEGTEGGSGLTGAEHDARDHGDVPGVEAAGLSEEDHAALDHEGVPGVEPAGLSGDDHDTRDHEGVPGVEAGAAFPLAVVATGEDEADASITATAEDAQASVFRIATTSGSGGADAGTTAEATGTGDAYANLAAETNDGNAMANAEAKVNGDGGANASSVAEVVGAGDADASSTATAPDGNATVAALATTNGSGAADASREAHATASGHATADTKAQSDTGDADANVVAETTTGGAQSRVTAVRGETTAGFVAAVDSNGLASVAAHGLPTEDPAEANALWLDNGTLRTSGAPAAAAAPYQSPLDRAAYADPGEGDLFAGTSLDGDWSDIEASQTGLTVTRPEGALRMIAASNPGSSKSFGKKKAFAPAGDFIVSAKMLFASTATAYHGAGIMVGSATPTDGGGGRTGLEIYGNGDVFKPGGPGTGDINISDAPFYGDRRQWPIWLAVRRVGSAVSSGISQDGCEYIWTTTTTIAFAVATIGLYLTGHTNAMTPYAAFEWIRTEG